MFTASVRLIIELFNIDFSGEKVLHPRHRQKLNLRGRKNTQDIHKIHKESFTIFLLKNFWEGIYGAMSLDLYIEVFVRVRSCLDHILKELARALLVSLDVLELLSRVFSTTLMM